MLNVSSNSWHARLYKSWYKRKYGMEPYRSYSNLCPYMRAVLFWSWMRPIFLTKWWSLIPWTLLAIEIPRWAGVISYELKSGILFTYSLAALITLGILFTIGMEKLMKKQSVQTKGEPFITLVREYGRSVHDRICPEVNFK